MAYTETTKQTYGNKVKNSFSGIGSGLLLIVIGTVLLWWNEGRAIKTTKALNEGEKVCIEMPDINTINPEFEGKLIHATGTAVSLDTLKDDLFAISVNAISLSREVEYYQWVESSHSESKEKIGGGTETVTTYTYEKQWVSGPVNSADFRDPAYQGSNSTLTNVESSEKIAGNVTFGAYRLPGFAISSLAYSTGVPVQVALPEELKAEWTKALSDTAAVVTVKGNQVYFGANPDVPAVGDIRISFSQVTPQKEISLLAKVIGDTFETYTAKNGQSVWGLQQGTVSAESMFEAEHQSNKVITWLLRILGAILVIGGFKNIFSFISTLFAVVPFIKKILAAGIGFVCTVVGIVWSLLVIAIAWIAHRPVLGISLLVVAAALIALLIVKANKKKRAEVVSAAMLLLALTFSVSCTGNGNGGSKPASGNSDEETVQMTTTLKASGLKGPVASVLEVVSRGEGEPDVRTYNYNEKGELTSIVDESEMEMRTMIINFSNGKPTDTLIIKDEGVEDDLSHADTLRDDSGRLSQIVYYDYYGKKSSTMNYEYDADGHLVRNVSTSQWGSSQTDYQYDGKGRKIREDYSYNGKFSSTELFEYDENDYFSRVESIFQDGSRNIRYATYDKDGEELSSRVVYVEADGSSRTMMADTIYFVGGVKHEDKLSYFEGPSFAKCTFTKEGKLATFAEYPNETGEGDPKHEAEFIYNDEGYLAKTILHKRNEYGSVETDERTYGKKDTWGNWTSVTIGPSYAISIDGTGIGSPEEIIALSSIEINREITYRGEDQGDCYHYKGSYNGNDVLLTYCEKNGIVRGEAQLEGVTYDVVGTHAENVVNVYSLDRDLEGLITLQMYVIFDEEFNRIVSTTFSNGEWKDIPLNEAKGEPYKKFIVKPINSSDVYGTYCYTHGQDLGAGRLDVYMNEWGNPSEGIALDFECITGPTGNIASDKFTSFDETGIHRQYLYDDDRFFSYEVVILDGYAIVRKLGGNPLGFFGNNATVEGVYCKMEAAG